MKKSLLKLDSYELLHDEEKKYLHFIWKTPSQYLDSEEVVDIFKESGRVISKLDSSPIYFLSDDRQRLFPYTISLQEDVAAFITEGLNKLGIQKYAILDPDDFILQLSTSQTTEEFNNPSFETEFFDSEAAALDWFGI